MSAGRPTAAVEHSLRSEYTPFELDSPLRRAGFNNLIGWVLIASGVALLVAAVAPLATGSGATFALAWLLVTGILGIVLLVLGWVMRRASLLLSADGHVIVRGLRTRTFDTRDIASFELGILPWSGSHRGPAPVVVLQTGERIPVRALNHSPPSFASEFDSEVVCAVCVELDALLARQRV